MNHIRTLFTALALTLPLAGVKAQPILLRSDPTARLSLPLLALLLFVAPLGVRGAGILAGPFTNTANAHLYYLLTQSTWTDAEAKALTLGGHLATINDAAENQWVFNTFATYGGVKRQLWIGLTDIRSGGNFQWISGQPRSYVNWSPVEPNNLGAEHYVLMYPPGIPPDAFQRNAGTWNNLRDWTSDIGLPCHGVVEIEPTYWLGVIGPWGNTNLWGPVYPNSNSVVVLTGGFVVTVDVPDAQVNALTLTPGSTLHVQPGGALTLHGPAVNNGTITLAGDVTSYSSGDAFVQNGTLVIDSGVAMKGLDCGGKDFAFVQAGGTTTVAGALDFGNGYIRVQGGSLNIAQDAAMKGFDGGGRDLAFVQTGGSVTIDGTFETSNAGLQGGTLGGSGVIAGNLEASGGFLSPGASPGTLTITNDFSQGADNTLLIELAGRATNQFDQLKIGGGAGLAGGLIVRVLPGFAPAIGDQFPILTAQGGLSGVFSRLDLPPGLSVSYNPTSAVLVVTGAVPVQILGPTLSGTNFVFTFPTATAQSYTVQFNDDLRTANWLFYTNFTGTGTFMPVEIPETDKPQRFYRVKQP